MTVERAQASHCAQLEEHEETRKYFHHLQTERLH